MGTVSEVAEMIVAMEMWFRREVESSRDLDDPIEPDATTETVCFRRGADENLDAFMDGLRIAAVTLKAFASERDA